MISAIVDGVLLLALVVTTVRLLTMHRELKRLGSYHTDYQRIFDQTALALDGIEVSIEEFNIKGSQVLNALGARMTDARDLIAEIDALTREAKRQQSVLKAELKELSRLTAEKARPQSFGKSDKDQNTSEQPTTADKIAAVNRFLKNKADTNGSEPLPTMVETARGSSDIADAGVLTSKPMRVHRIEEGGGSPFRSISLGSSLTQKDDI